MSKGAKKSKARAVNSALIRGPIQRKFYVFLLPTFLALGIDELSVTPNAVLPLRAAIRKSIAATCTLEMLEC